MSSPGRKKYSPQPTKHPENALTTSSTTPHGLPPCIPSSELSSPKRQQSFHAPYQKSTPVLKQPHPGSPSHQTAGTTHAPGSSSPSSDILLDDHHDPDCILTKDARRKPSGAKEPANSNTPKEKSKDNVGKASKVVLKPKTDLLSIPETNFAIGLLVMCCFNPPFGLLALYFSLRSAAAYRDGDKSKGSWCAKASIVVSLLGIMLTMVVISSVVLYIAVNKHGGKQANKRASSTSLGF